MFSLKSQRKSMLFFTSTFKPKKKVLTLQSMEERLDKILVDRQLVSSRTRAEQIIKEFGVKVNGKLIQKTGKKFPPDVNIELIEEEISYVSRGALKLIAALDQFKIAVADKIGMDIGACTGGFTEVLLERNVTKVFSVDVGTNQLHPKIKENSKVVNLEKTHVRELNHKVITEPIDFCCIDVSFISITKIFPFIHAFLKPNAIIVGLIKPQFEVGKENISKGGIVKDKKLYAPLLEEIKKIAAENNLIYQDFIESPILGGDGNREFLMYFLKRN